MSTFKAFRKTAGHALEDDRRLQALNTLRLLQKPGPALRDKTFKFGWIDWLRKKVTLSEFAPHLLQPS